jgi:hypothetical protein
MPTVKEHRTTRRVKYWLHQLIIGRTNLQNKHSRGRPPVDDVDAQILAMLANRPSSSVLSIADAVGHPSSTIHVHMEQRLNM